MYKLSIALRYLLTRRIAYISIAAIAFGVMAMIVVLSIMDGFQKRIYDSIRAIDSPLVVRSDDDWVMSSPNHFADIVEKLAPFTLARGGEVSALSKRLVTFGLASRRYDVEGQPMTISNGVRMLGVDIDLERQVIPWERMLDKIEIDRFRVPRDEKSRAAPFIFRDGAGRLRAEPGIVLGKYLANELRVIRGDTITVTFARVDPENPDRLEPVSERFIVTGCFECGRYDYDRLTAFCDGAVLQELLGRRNDCDMVAVALRDPEKAEGIRAALKERYGRGLDVRTLRDQMGSLAGSLDMEKGILLVIMSIIVLVAGASICGILYMLVLEKTRDIGILVAMGATSGGITSVFLIYGGILGFLGSVFGVVLGVNVVWYLNEIAAFLDRSVGIRVFPPEIYQFDQIPSYVDPESVLVMSLGAFGASLVASLVPAYRASRLDPVRCLAYE